MTNSEPPFAPPDFASLKSFPRADLASAVMHPTTKIIGLHGGIVE